MYVEYPPLEVFSQFPAYSADSSVKIPLTACKYRKQAVYEVVVIGYLMVICEMSGWGIFHG
jgi:hypothetical protein